MHRGTRGLIHQGVGLSGQRVAAPDVSRKANPCRVADDENQARVVVAGALRERAALDEQGLHLLPREPQPPAALGQHGGAGAEPQPGALLALGKLGRQREHALPVSDRLGDIAAPDPLRSAPVPARRLERLARLLQVVGDHRGLLVELAADGSPRGRAPRRRGCACGGSGAATPAPPPA